jgi:hypothetical protein
VLLLLAAPLLLAPLGRLPLLLALPLGLDSWLALRPLLLLMLTLAESCLGRLALALALPPP